MKLRSVFFPKLGLDRFTGVAQRPATLWYTGLVGLATTTSDDIRAPGESPLVTKM
jgi:hypothetical protein